MVKQSSLFSFFSSKPGAAKASAPSSKPAAKKSKPSSSSTTSSLAKPPAQAPPDAPSVKIGDLIEIYWPDDSEYYACTVTSHLKNDKWEVTYDDGASETVDLSEQEWKVASKNALRRGSQGSGDEAEFDEDAMDEESFKGDVESSSEEEEDWMVDDDEEEADDDVFDESDEEESPKKKKRRLGGKKGAPQSVSDSKPKGKVSFSPDYEQPSKSPKTPKTPSNQLSQFKLTMEKTPVSSAVTPLPAVRAPSPAAGVGETTKPAMWTVGEVNPMGTHVHNHLPFLYPENLRDAKGVKYGEPGYDKRTLSWDKNVIEKVTASKLTDAKKQWWEIKAQYFDTVLLFKTGKFYEMFHMDSDIGVKVLNFTHMKGAEGHSGFPESAYGVMCAKLVKAGYKVARVEQTETPAQLAERKKRTPKGQKKPGVVNREVCAVTTVGTRTFCYLDSDACFQANSKFKEEGQKGPLLVVNEVMIEQSSTSMEDGDDTPPAVCEYGVAMIDAVRGVTTLGQFADDKLRSRLHTLLVSTNPSEVILRTNASQDLAAMVKQCCGGAPVEVVSTKETLPKSRANDPKIRQLCDRPGPFNPWNHEDCVGQIKRKKYFGESSKSAEKEDSMGRWPKVIKACVEGGANMALGALGAAIFYLQRSLVDYEIMTMASVRAYVPPASTNAKVEGTKNAEGNTTLSQMSEEVFTKDDGVKVDAEADAGNTDHMQLDGITLDNLEILVNQVDGKAKGSLWAKVNRTKTPHGARLLRGWLLRPLFKKDDINRRMDAVQELATGSAALTMGEARPLLGKVGDIERLLSRVHSMGCNEEGHPANRQVLYEGKTHTKRKVEDFERLLSGLKAVNNVANLFADVKVDSPLLKKVVKRGEAGGAFPEISEKLKWFVLNFDLKKAKEGNFSPIPGMDEEYDRANEEREACLQELYRLEKDYCDEISGARGKWKYINIKPDSKDKFMVELPVSVRVPPEFKVKGKRGSGAKQVNKYYTADIEEVVERLNNAYDAEREGRARGLATIFAKFDSYRPLWSIAVQCSCMLDALGSLAEVSSQPGWCRPTILESGGAGTSSISIEKGRHPCVDNVYSGDDFVPNDITLGGQGSARVLLLSGPNMGGKSTLLRQTSLIAILAQIGCYVPAEAASLTPVDRVFTRLGASDRILQGQSTFFVELSEAAAALRGATHNSLVIMDELGRGTSTFDGTALAHAVIKSLVSDSKCLSLFATHYHSLLSAWSSDPDAKLGHMASHVEGGDIVFLYRLTDGACPRSFGINVARLAGLPEEVLAIAKERSEGFEKEAEDERKDIEAKAKKIEALLQAEDVEGLRALWREMQD